MALSQEFPNNCHALVVGVGSDLPFTVDDARALSAVLGNPQRCAIPKENIRLLVEETADRKSFISELDRLVQTCDPESTAIVYFSGHGCRTTSGETHHFLLPFGYDLEKLASTAIHANEFEEKLSAIRARKLLVILDCCHAGGFTFKDSSVRLAEKCQLPREALERMSAGAGRVVIFSSTETELSYGGNPYSAFTQALLEALSGRGASKKDGFVRVADLALYARERVTELTNRNQHPICDFTKADNFVICYYSGGKTEELDLFDSVSPSIESFPGEHLSNTTSGPNSISIQTEGDAAVAAGQNNRVTFVKNEHLSKRFRIGFVVASVVLIAVIVFLVGQQLRMIGKVDDVTDNINNVPGTIKDEIVAPILSDPDILAARLIRHIHKRADSEITKAKESNLGWKTIAGIESRRNASVKKVSAVIETIRKGLLGDPIPIFEETVAILDEYGVEEAINFLESKKPAILNQVDGINERQQLDEEQKRKLIEFTVILQGTLYELDLKWEKAANEHRVARDKAENWHLPYLRHGEVLRILGRYEEAEKSLKKAISLDKNGQDLPRSFYSLGVLYQVVGDYEKAEEYLLYSIQSCSSVEENPLVANSLNYLSAILLETNRAYEAEMLLYTANHLLGEGQNDIFLLGQVYGNLGRILTETGRLKEAENVLVEAISIQVGSRPNYVESATISDIGNLFNQRDDTAKGALFHLYALRLSECVFGPAHTSSARDLNNLGRSFEGEGLFTEAESLYRRSIDINETDFSSVHRDVAAATTNLIRLWRTLGRGEPAFLLAASTLKTMLRNAEEDSPNVATLYGTIGLLLQDRGENQAAEFFFRKALAMSESSDGISKDNLPRDLKHLANLLQRHHPELAIALAVRSLKINEGKYGAVSGPAANDLSVLSTIYWANNQPQLAYEIGRRSLIVTENTFSVDHPKILHPLNNLTVFVGAIGQSSTCESMLIRAIPIAEKRYGQNHDLLATLFNNLGQACHSSGRLREAEVVLRRALSINLLNHGYEHPKVARDLRDLALVVQRRGNTEDAQALFRHALAVFEATSASMSFPAAFVANNLADLLRQEEEYELAEILGHQCFSVFVSSAQQNGSKHSLYDAARSNYKKILLKLGTSEDSATAKISKIERNPVNLTTVSDQIDARLGKLEELSNVLLASTKEDDQVFSNLSLDDPFFSSEETKALKFTDEIFESAEFLQKGLTETPIIEEGITKPLNGFLSNRLDKGFKTVVEAEEVSSWLNEELGHCSLREHGLDESAFLQSALKSLGQEDEFSLSVLLGDPSAESWLSDSLTKSVWKKIARKYGRSDFHFFELPPMTFIEKTIGATGGVEPIAVSLNERYIANLEKLKLSIKSPVTEIIEKILGNPLNPPPLEFN